MQVVGLALAELLEGLQEGLLMHLVVLQVVVLEQVVLVQVVGLVEGLVLALVLGKEMEQVEGQLEHL